MKTRLMRVPCDFHDVAKKLSKKRGYKFQTEFLHEEGVRLFNNADKITDVFDVFRSSKKRKKGVL